MRSSIWMTAVFAMCFTGSAGGQTNYAGDSAKTTSVDSELQAVEITLAEERKARAGSNTDSLNQLRAAMETVLDEARSGGEVSWNTERAFWNAALRAVFSGETSESVLAKRDALLSGLRPRKSQMHWREWKELAGRLECLLAANESSRELKALFDAGKATVDLCLEEIASLSEDAARFSQCLMSRIPCEDPALRDGLLLELRLKYAKAECLANFETWSTCRAMASGGIGTRYREVSTRARLYRSLAELQKLRFQQEKQKSDKS